MATISFDIFKQPNNTKKPYVYSDLHLDLIQDVISGSASASGITGKDIILDFDLAAIRNSLTNLFNTIPGQRILLPTYGLNLLQYVFQPISKEYANIIGNEIVRAVETWEPRVQIERVAVNARPDDNEYDISFVIYLPALKDYTSLEGTISNKGFAPIIRG